MKNLITKNEWVPLNIVVMSCIGLSLLLQFLVSIIIVFLSKQGEFIDETKRNGLIRGNNLLTFLVLVVSILNVFISVFLVI